MAMIALRCRLIMSWSPLLQQELLHPPVLRLANVELAVRRTGERIGAGKLPEVAPRPSDDTEHRAVERYLEDTSRIRRLADEHHLRRARRDAHRVRRADRARERFARRRNAVDGTRRRVRR